MPDTFLRSAPAPIRAAALCLAIVVALGIIALIMVLVQGGTTGFGLVSFVLAAFALLNVRRVGEGNATARVIATLLCVVLIVFRVAFLYLITASGIDIAELALPIAQLGLEILLIVAAIVLLYRPAVSAHLQR